MSNALFLSNLIKGLASDINFFKKPFYCIIFFKKVVNKNS